MNVKRWVREFKAKLGMNTPNSPLLSSRSVSPSPHSPAKSPENFPQYTVKPDPVIMIVGNKSDLDKTCHREVGQEEGQAYALANNFLWMETCAKDHEQVQLAFDVFIGQVFHEVVQPPIVEHRRKSAPAASNGPSDSSAPNVLPGSDQTSKQGSLDRLSTQAMSLLGNFGSSVLDLVEEVLEGAEDVMQDIQTASDQGDGAAEEIVDAPDVPSFAFQDMSDGEVRLGRGDVPEGGEDRLGAHRYDVTVPLRRSRSVNGIKE